MESKEITVKVNGGNMKILKQEKREFVDLEVEMSEKTSTLLMDYATKKMGEKEKRDTFINWAVNDILHNMMPSVPAKKRKVK
jgi:hypothetical protein